MASDAGGLVAALKQRDVAALVELTKKLGKPTKDVLEGTLSKPEVYAAFEDYFQWIESGEAGDPVCEWVFGLLGKDSNDDNKTYVVSLLPILVFSALIRSSNHLPSSGIEAILATFYDQEAIFRDRVRVSSPESLFFSLPSSASDSSRSPNTNTASSSSSSSSSAPGHSIARPLLLFDEVRKIEHPGPSPNARYNPTNRVELFRGLPNLAFSLYRRHLSSIPVAAYKSLLNVLTKIVVFGQDFVAEGKGNVDFHKREKDEVTTQSLRKVPIHLSLEANQELVNVLSGLITQRQTEIKVETFKVLRLLQQRFQLELDAPLLLSVNSLLHLSIAAV